MKRVRIVSLIAATLAVAVGAGTMFQQKSTRQAETPAVAAASTQTETSLLALATRGAVTEQAADDGGLPDPLTATASPADDGRNATPPEVDFRLAQAAAEHDGAADYVVASASNDPVLIDELLAEVDACAVWLVVTPENGAMLDMSLFAPCDGGALVQISHGAIGFDARIANDGQLALSVPALAVQAELTVNFEDGRSATDATEVADAVLYDRFAIQWHGPAVLGLNAYEFGAGYGAEGHVHPANPAAPGLEARGFLSQLGENARAQVYSFPAGLPARAGQVELELEAAITSESCATRFSVDTVEALAGSEAIRRVLQLEMPECDGQGGFLVLKNLLPEMTIALN